jgi:tRNA (cmo5U34)-methyltransferase
MMPMSSQESLGHVPTGPWAFDPEVTRVFDDMLERSIPQYDVMRRSVFDIGRRFVQPDTAIVDLGCSRGGAMQPFVREFGSRNRFIGIEVSAPMRAAAEEQFASEIRDGFVEIHATDLRSDYPSAPASLTLGVLVLQFVPIEYRQGIVRQIYKNTVPGGAAVIVEKVLGADSEVDGLLVELYLQMKRKSGYTQEEIDRKRLSLEGRLVPVTARWNEDLLSGAGFQHVDCFWRWMNFSAWVAIREAF